MGLDMYLTAKRYLSKHFNEGDDQRAAAIQSQFPELANRKDHWGESSPVKEVSIDAGYWRKANAIHDWFVKNVQGGVDECEPHYVSREDLLRLKEICEQVLADHTQARALLPTTSGFFFGSTEYDDWYFEDIRATIRIIEDALDLPASWEFEYRSSW